jgi:hypothetical protein
MPAASGNVQERFPGGVKPFGDIVGRGVKGRPTNGQSGVKMDHRMTTLKRLRIRYPLERLK